MKYILFLLIPIIFSCNKSGGSYTAPPPNITTTTDFRLQYTPAGLVPTLINTGNGIAGTTWVLTRMTVGFVTLFPNDTLRFITNTTYTINSGSDRPYQLTSGVASTNKALTLYFFTPFNGSHWSGQIAGSYLMDKVINNAEFTNIQNTTSRVRAFFKEI